MRSGGRDQPRKLRLAIDDSLAQKAACHDRSQLKMNWQALLGREWLRAAAVLAFILNVIFFPFIWGDKTLLMSARDAPSITRSGAYHQDPPGMRVSRTIDPGAPAWQPEPQVMIESNQYWTEHSLPLWNPYSAYGTPLAAAMIPQPFYPLTFILSFHPTPWTYNFLVVGRLFVAGLLMFLFARLFVGFLPSLFAAITFMLAGYFVMYMDMPHLSVEVLLPGVFLSFELLLRKNSWVAVSGTAGMILLCVTGGMPESLFLVISFGCVYFIFRLAVTPEFRGRALARLAKFAAALALGFALSAFLLLPFLEFMGVSHDVHQVANLGGNARGLEFYADGRATLTYLLPLIFGPVGNSILMGSSGWNGMYGYWGVVPCVFALAALLCWFFPVKISYVKPLRSLTAFLALSLAAMMLKRFGDPIINWIGILPLADMINYPKYLEPLMVFCIAMLAGIGFALLVERRAKSGYFFTAALLVLGVMLALAGWSLPRVLEHKDYAVVYYMILLAGVLVVLAAVTLLVVPAASMIWLAWAFIGLLSVELSLNFIVPSFYLFNSLPSVRMNPYGGAPYLDFLQQRNVQRSRVFAREGFLNPNWAGVFALMDVRDLDAMYYRRYINFIRSFLLRSDDETRIEGELADRFTGLGDDYAYNFETDLEQRFLTLSSIRYVITATELGADTSLINEFLNQHRAEKLWGVGLDSFPIASHTKALGVFQHPPSRRLSLKTTIDPTQPVLAGVAAIKAEVQDKSDGAGFLIEIKSRDKIEPLFSTVLSPRDVREDQRGRPFRIDLSSYAGQEVELLFSTDPGPSGINAYDWAGWAKLRFVPKDHEPISASAFREIYQDEARIYEFPDVLPRAAMFNAAEILPDKDVLDRLKDLAFDPQKLVVLSAESLPDGGNAVLKSLAATVPATAPISVSASIVSYASQRVLVETQSEAPAILMLNDANYPGWRAFVNGNPAPILQADYLFRGVVVPAGHVTVEFDYAPASFRIGALISLAGLIVLVVPLFSRGLRRRYRARAAAAQG